MARTRFLSVKINSGWTWWLSHSVSLQINKHSMSPKFTIWCPVKRLLIVSLSSLWSRWLGTRCPNLFSITRCLVSISCHTRTVIYLSGWVDELVWLVPVNTIGNHNGTVDMPSFTISGKTVTIWVQSGAASQCDTSYFGWRQSEFHVFIRSVSMENKDFWVSCQGPTGFKEWTCML